jgi:hypothetical protein
MSTGESSSEFQRLLAEWQKCYSNKRKRDYYFNSSTGESLWTIEEVKAQIEAFLKQKNSSKKDAHHKNQPQSSKKPLPTTSSNVKSSASVHDIQMSIEDTHEDANEEDIPMEIDEIVENVGFMKTKIQQINILVIH